MKKDQTVIIRELLEELSFLVYNIDVKNPTGSKLSGVTSKDITRIENLIEEAEDSLD